MADVDIMFDSSVRLTRLRVLWVASFVVPAALQLSLAVVWSEAGIQGSPALLFGIVLVAASLCAITSGMVINRAKRTNEAELGYLGVFFLTVSILPLVHGILTPGVIFDDPAPSAAAAFWSVPAAVVVGVPSFLMRSELGIRIDKHWWRWVVNCVLAVVTLAAAAPPDIPLKNTAKAGVAYPFVGLGVYCRLACALHLLECTALACV